MATFVSGTCINGSLAGVEAVPRLHNSGRGVRRAVDYAVQVSRSITLVAEQCTIYLSRNMTQVHSQPPLLPGLLLGHAPRARHGGGHQHGDRACRVAAARIH